ncbi:LysM peptidoglycan-binding domain-containing protein [Paracnuella aquatica]|uniref:LysM peptidoglycan-binding domain-containing protein n=1 Tax=Paracnuella aquatica TaxID=2268757 RepID=UPI00139061FB|nr:LysM peptidoglycan-binding domain-containing protein [Paracnuella aquatica]
MKKLLLLLAFGLVALTGFAQNEVLVHSNDKGLYVPHTVAAKENFYSIGRLYAISPKDIASFNGVDMANGLSVGQTINIPLNNTNFSQTAQSGTPVYYVVGEKEGLYRVSVKNNKVSMASLRQWNKLSSDNISTGQKLIVGYIQSTGVPATSTNAVAATPAPRPQEQPVSANNNAAANNNNSVAANNTVPPPTQTQNTQTQTAAPSVTAAPKPAAPRQLSTSGSGYFKNQFEQQSRSSNAGKEVTANGSIFKTTSGWQDGKFYALMDGVEPGTIIRVVNPTNSKVVFAKVLGEMSGIRQNSGLDVRISNAAATALEIGEQDKFVVKVNY